MNTLLAIPNNGKPVTAYCGYNEGDLLEQIKTAARDGEFGEGIVSIFRATALYSITTKKNSPYSISIEGRE